MIFFIVLWTFQYFFVIKNVNYAENSILECCKNNFQKKSNTFYGNIQNSNFLSHGWGGRLLEGKMRISFLNSKSAWGAKYRKYGKLSYVKPTLNI